jgi:competence protein ComEC
VQVGPLLTLTVLSGVACGVVLSAPAAGACLAAALAFASIAAIVPPRVPRLTCVVAVVALASMAHGAAARDRVLDAPLASWSGTDTDPRRSPVVVTGRLVDDATAIDPGVRLLIDVQTIDDDRGTHAVVGRIQAYVGGDRADGLIRDWTAGRSIRAPMTLRRPPVWVNPGGPSERWQTLRRPFVLTGSVKSALVVQITPGNWWDEWAAAVRARVRQSVAKLFADPDDPTGAVVIAILIGDRSWLDAPLERRLQVAGTYHVIAISGGNVALLTAGIYVCLRLVLRSGRLISGLTMASVLTYGWIVGGDPSVTRAVAVAFAYLAIGVIGLVPPALNVLAVVAVLLTLHDPLTVIDAGAWLSFGATFGIIVGAGRLVRWHDAHWPGLTTVGLGRRWLVGLCGATLAAELTLLPVTATLFTRVGVAGLVLNVVAIPMIAIVQVAGIVGIAVVEVWETGAAAAGAVARLATAALLGSSTLVDVAPWLSWRVPPPAGLAAVAFYVTGLAWIAASPRLLRRAGGIALMALVLVVALEPATGLKQPRLGVLRLTMVDVGQGDAILVQFPTGRSLLVDAGGAGTRSDVGDRVVGPALWASGVRRLDWLAITHADLDHIGGAVALTATFRPREVWEGVPVPRELERRRLTLALPVWRELQRHDRMRIGDVTLEVLNPPLPDWERQRVRNEDSLVFRLRYGDVEMLLTGDVGAETERVLALHDEPAPLRILKVAHHGSRTSSSTAFIERYAPQVALISAGRGNPFGHPAPEVVERLRAIGARVFRTDQDGAAVIETDGRSVTVRSMRGHRWAMRVWRTNA